jgi:peptidoglycan/LPS O-acetylase OafA/YrhL
VRGLAIVLVLLFHYRYTLGIGWAGVQLFFVLSGFLITSILLKEKESPLDFYLKRFYWRRTLRIFPLYYAYILMAGLVFILSGLPQDFLEFLPFLATYTFNFYPLAKLYSYEDYFFMHFWSLSVEEQFYFVWPAVIFFCSRKQLRVILIMVIAGAPIVRYVLAEIMLARGHSDHYLGETVYRFTLSQWDGFAFGAMIPVFSLGSRKLPVGKMLLLTFALLLVLGMWNSHTLILQGRTVLPSSLGYQIGELVNYQHVWSYTLFDFLFFLLILYVAYPSLKRKKAVEVVMGNPILVYTGKISYGLYVYHWIIIMTFNKYLLDWFPYPGLGMLAYFFVTFAVASGSYFIYERPILSLKDRLFHSVNPAT